MNVFLLRSEIQPSRSYHYNNNVCTSILAWLIFVVASNLAIMLQRRRSSVAACIQQSRSSSNRPILMKINENALKRLKNATNLSKMELIYRYEEFYRQYPNGEMNKNSFRKLCAAILVEDEVDKFSNEVFDLFDADKNDLLTFEEFILATEVQDVKDCNPLYKLAWLYDNVYDVVRGHVQSQPK